MKERSTVLRGMEQKETNEVYDGPLLKEVGCAQQYEEHMTTFETVTANKPVERSIYGHAFVGRVFLKIKKCGIIPLW